MDNTFERRYNMEDISIVRNLDKLGRIVLPKELRRRMDLDSRDEVELFIDGNTIILKKYKQASCLFCGRTEYLMNFNDYRICRSCAGKICDLKEAKDKE